MLNSKQVKFMPIALEHYGFLMKPFAAIKYGSIASKMLTEELAFPAYTFHIHSNNGSTLGISSGDTCYPSHESESYRTLTQMIIKLEDKRFFYHFGLDIKGIIRALRANFTQRRLAQGGSTITQQLIRNILLSPDKSLSRKILEAYLAIKIETLYNKSEILKAYCAYYCETCHL